MTVELDADADIFELDCQVTLADEPTNPPVTLLTAPRHLMPTTPTAGCQFESA